jgi:hypothetical protein
MDRIDLSKRLAFVRYMYQIGEQQAETPLPYGALAVLSFHDSIEWFLLTACEYHTVNASEKATVHQYFDLLRSLDITGKMALNKINSARNGLKHRLTIPSSISIRDLQVLTKNFLEENTSILFDAGFADISMLDMIVSDSVRSNLQEAKCCINQARYDKARICVASAFRTLYQRFELNLLASWWISVGVDQFDLRLFHRFVPAEAIYTGDTEQSAFSRPATKVACEFCFDFGLDTTIRVEQRLHDKLTKLQKIMEAELEEVGQPVSVPPQLG